MGYESLTKEYSAAQKKKGTQPSVEEIEKTLSNTDMGIDALDEELQEALGSETSFKIEDESEQSKRQETSQKMRKAMLTLIDTQENPAYKCNLSGTWRGFPLLLEIGPGEEVKAKNLGLIQGLGQNKEEDREKIRDLMFDRLVELSRTYTTEDIDGMSDDKLAENAVKVHRYLQAIGEIQQLSETANAFFVFTEEQNKKLKEIAQEKGGANIRHRRRMDVISSPYYAYIDTKKLEQYELKEITELQENEEISKHNAANSLITDVVGLESGKCSEWSEQIRKDLESKGISMDNVESVTLSSGEYATPNDVKLLGNLVNKRTSALVRGKDGTEVAVFRGKNNREAVYGSAADYLNRLEKRKINRLSKQIEEADPWYLRSSKEYKAMKAGMEELVSSRQDYKSPLTLEQMEAMKKKYTDLQKKSDDYLKAKMKQRDAKSVEQLKGNTPREKKRVTTAKALDNFLKTQIADLDRRLEIEKTKQQEKQVTSAADGKQEKRILQDKREKALDRLLEYKKLATEQRGLDPKETNYNKFCDRVIAAAEGLQAYIVGEVTGVDKVRGYMQDLTLFNMVRMERVVTKEKPGVIEGMIRESSHSSVLNAPGMRDKIYNGIFKQTQNSLKRDHLMNLFAEGRERLISMDVLGIKKDVLQEQAPAPFKNIEKEKRFEEKSIGGI